MKLLYTTKVVAALMCVGAASVAQAQVAFSGSYTQNFNSMTGTAAPTGWSVYSESGSNSTFAPPGTAVAGVSPNFTAGTLTAEATLTVATPTGQDGAGGYNWTNSLATVGNGEGSHSLGSSPTGTAATILELGLTNNTGSAISALSLGYDIDRFTTTANNNGVIGTAPNAGVEEYPGYQLFYNLTPGNNSDWVNVASLNPTIDAGTGGTVSVPNSIGITIVSPTTVQLSGTWANGATLDLAWFDDNAESPSPDQDIGLNNVAITTAPEPSPIALLSVGILIMLMTMCRWQRA